MLFFSDMDGTFLRPDKSIGPVSRAALDAIAAGGHQFIPCTGRAATGLEPELLRHPAVRYAISANGACIEDLRAGTVLHRVELGRERTQRLFALAEGRDVTFDLFADGMCYLTRPLFDRLDEFALDANILKGMVGTRTPYDMPTPAFIDTLGHIDRISYYWHDPADRDALCAAVDADETLARTQSYPNNIEVSDRAATKGTAVAWLCEHLGVARKEAAAFGDQLNDLPMLVAAGTGVAVANAVDEVRRAADVICLSNAEEGVARWILETLEARV